MRALIAAAALVAVSLPAGAQQHGAGHDHAAAGLPAGWHGRVDRETQNIDEVRFMTMGSGYHIITGPHVILWDADRAATGEYRAAASFRQTKAPERLEGFGLFVGGRDLDGPGQDYLYFLARHDGRYMIRHRAGAEVHTLAEWTPHSAVNQATADAPATNLLAIEARVGEVRFLINDQLVHTLPRVAMLNTDGIVGLRVGHHLDVHVTDFMVQPFSSK
jgi:hypothetical protein